MSKREAIESVLRDLPVVGHYSVFDILSDFAEWDGNNIELDYLLDELEFSKENN